MVKLVPQSPLGDLDVTVGTVRLREEHIDAIWSLSAGTGGDSALSAALVDQTGLPFPEPGELYEDGDVSTCWTGPQQAFLLGAAPSGAVLAAGVATPQTDACAVMRLSGADSADVLARLVAVDLRPQRLGPGHVARCQLGHMACILGHLEDGSWRIMVFRSMAKHAAEEIRHAMDGVAARAARPN